MAGRQAQAGAQKVSYSRLQNFETCPRQYFFRYELGLPEPPSHALALGTVVHTLLEMTMLGQPKAEVDRRAEELVAATPPLKLDADLPVVLEMLRRARRFQPLAPDAERQVEQWLELDVGGGVLLRGKADLIEVARSGVRLTDWKTGWKSYGVDDTRQLDLYAAAVARAHPGAPIWVQLRFLRYGEQKGLVGRESGPEHQEAALAWVQEVAADIREAQSLPWQVGFPARPGPACGTCSYALQCLQTQAQERGVDGACGPELLRAVLGGEFREPEDAGAAAHLAGWLRVLDRAVKTLKEWLQGWAERHGPVAQGGEELAMRFHTSWRLRDATGFFQALHELLAEHGDGTDPWSFFRLDERQAGKLAKTPAGQELLREYAEEVVDRSYLWWQEPGPGEQEE